MGYSPWGCKQLVMTEQLTLSLSLLKTVEIDHDLEIIFYYYVVLMNHGFMCFSQKLLK